MTLGRVKQASVSFVADYIVNPLVRQLGTKMLCSFFSMKVNSPIKLFPADNLEKLA